MWSTSLLSQKKTAKLHLPVLSSKFELRLESLALKMIVITLEEAVVEAVVVAGEATLHGVSVPSLAGYLGDRDPMEMWKPCQ